VHAALAEYIPVCHPADGAVHRGRRHPHPRQPARQPGLNTAILAIGAFLASFMGTTGASMLMIRPLIRANDNRTHKAHVVVFFIFIVSNAGGSLTPLGDPPLFLGFLKGVDFLLDGQAHLPRDLFLVGALLAIFYALDSWYYHRREEVMPVDPTPDTRGIGFDGVSNFWLLAAIVVLVLMSGFWKSPVSFNVMGYRRGPARAAARRRA
jgi:Na+/H+ antiporter NhaD/arsenite permease-like protein